MARPGRQAPKQQFTFEGRYRFRVTASKNPAVHIFLEMEGLEKMIELFGQYLTDIDHPYAKPEYIKNWLYQAMIAGEAQSSPNKKPSKAVPKTKAKVEPSITKRSVEPKKPLERPALREPTKEIGHEARPQPSYESPIIVAQPIEVPQPKVEVVTQAGSTGLSEARKDLEKLRDLQANPKKRRNPWANDEV